jgi:hypothetical protein
MKKTNKSIVFLTSLLISSYCHSTYIPKVAKGVISKAPKAPIVTQANKTVSNQAAEKNNSKNTITIPSKDGKASIPLKIKPAE